jgi:hypothetical protein
MVEKTTTSEPTPLTNAEVRKLVYTIVDTEAKSVVIDEIFDLLWKSIILALCVQGAICFIFHDRN